MTFLDAIKILPHNNKAETLLKLKQFKLFSVCEDIAIHTFWSSILIAIKHKYRIADVKLWLDYLELLKYYGKDIRNPHYICPKNLKQEHDRWVGKKRKDDLIVDKKREYTRALKDLGEYDEVSFLLPKNWLKELPALKLRVKSFKLEQKQKELELEDIKYQKFIQPFLDLNISNKQIKVVVLSSIDEFKKEGELLNHCVYANEYFKRKNCLILSATVNGIKTETIEVSLQKLEVVQCRGLQNQNSEYHDTIVNLVNKNMREIQRRANKRVKDRSLQLA